jgi:predicted Zn-dependent protease
MLAKTAERIPVDTKKLFGVVDADLFVPGLNFVFGLASGNVAVGVLIASIFIAIGIVIQSGLAGDFFRIT